MAPAHSRLPCREVQTKITPSFHSWPGAWAFSSCFSQDDFSLDASSSAWPSCIHPIVINVTTAIRGYFLCASCQLLPILLMSLTGCHVPDPVLSSEQRATNSFLAQGAQAGRIRVMCKHTFQNNTNRGMNWMLQGQNRVT